MPWTTPETFTAGQTLTAASMNAISGDAAFLYKPPMCMVRRTTTASSYTSAAAIVWESQGITSTDGTMWTSGDATKVTINTAGLYSISFCGYATSAAGLTNLNPTINVNGTGIAQNYCYTYANTGLWAISTLASLTVGQYVTASVQFLGGSSYAIVGSATLDQTQTRLAVTWVGNPA